ncbi:MAG: DUF4957 domain-containing protein [Bacteroidales bacterium]|nr:DUF4957 domain-containing protein [Bacteroidales bacterium]
MKRFTSFCLAVVAMMLLAVPQAKAIITDPDDYIIWDSGILGSQSGRDKFVKPDFMLWSVGVELSDSIGTLGRGVEDEHMEEFGFAPGVKAADHKNKTTMGGLLIKQRKNDDATANGERFEIDYATFMGLKGAEKLLPWTYDKEHNKLARPSDSIVIRVPKTCDSIYIQGLGINTPNYALMVAEEGVSGVAPATHGSGATMRTNVYHIGYNTGYVLSMGFKPKHVSPGDSTTLIIFGSNKDFYADNKNGDLKPFCKDGNATKRKQIFSGETITDEDGTVRPRYIECERWGQWTPTSINRIKIYGKIEKGEVPVFDGTHSAFTFSYQTRPSGTVELTKPLKQENGWNGTAFTKYASDLGVVRSVLSASSYIYLGYDKDFGSYATKLNVVNATHDTVNYERPAHHSNFYHVTVPTTGFQDMTLDFDYAVRGANLPVIVAAYVNGDTTCMVLDTLANSANPSKELAHASIAIPNEFANQKNLIVRFVLGKGALSGTTEFDLANLTFKGYNDYYTSVEGAAKVAYLTPAEDRIHVMKLSQGADSSDVILPYLLQDQNFTTSIISKDVWSAWSSEEAITAAFADYDVVVASPYMTEEDLTFTNVLVGKKPFLHFNAQTFLSWNANATLNEATTDTAMVYTEEFYYHPVFGSVDLDEEKMEIPSFFSALSSGVKVSAADNQYVLASLNETGAAVIFEDYSVPAAKYVFMDMSADNSKSINSKGKQVIANLINYLKKGGNFAKPTFELISTGAIVENYAQLKDAANYDYGVLNLTTPVIKMKTSTDANAVYQIGEGFSFGGNNITFAPNSSSDDVVIVGALTDADELDATHLTFKNITFVPADAQTSLISLKDNDKLTSELKFENCTFNNLKEGFVALTGKNNAMKAITLNNNLFNGVEMSSLIKVAADTASLHTVNVSENRFYDYKAAALLEWNTTVTKEIDDDDADGDELLAININHNTFRNATPSEDSHKLIAMETVQVFDTASVVVNNNLFYNTGAAVVELFNAPEFNEYITMDGETEVRDTVYFGSYLNLDKNFVEAAEITFLAAERWVLDDYDMVTKEDLNIATVFDDAELTQISKLSPLYTAGVASGLNRAYVGAAANYTSRHAGDETTFVVKNAPELKTALELAIGGDIIELETNTEDSLGIYQLGQDGFTYPATGGKLIIRAAEGHQPVLFGNMAPSNANFNLDELLIENLTWNDPTVQETERIEGYNADAYSPFYFRAAGGYIGLFHITNSAFKNLEMQSVVRTNKCYDETAGTGLTIGEILMDYNEFDNFGGATPDGQVAYHFVQFDVKGSYTINNFTFIENIVKNFHGSQMFNINREGSLNAADSTINIKIINNLFYKIGGNAPDKYRNFLEFNKAPVGHTVNIDITNNVFYKRWSDVLTGQYPQGQLDLFDGSQVKAYTINIKKNYYEGEYYNSDESFGCNPMALTDAGPEHNLSLSPASAVEVNRDAALDWNNVNDYIELDEDTEDFTNNVDQGADVFGLGEEHPYNPEYKYIGVGLMYGVEQMETPDAVEDVLVAKFAVFANNGKLFINVAEKAQVEIYHISGAKVATKALNAGLNEIGALSNGMYILNIAGQMAKVLVK